MTVPVRLVRTIQVLASASLFIYMTHLTGIVQFLRPLGPVVTAMAGLLQGVLVWQLFTILQPSFTSALQQSLVGVIHSLDRDDLARLPLTGGTTILCREDGEGRTPSLD